MAAGIDTQRCAKLAGPGCHDTIAAATRTQQTIRSSVFIAVPALSPGLGGNWFASHGNDVAGLRLTVIGPSGHQLAAFFQRRSAAIGERNRVIRRTAI